MPPASTRKPINSAGKSAKTAAGAHGTPRKPGTPKGRPPASKRGNGNAADRGRTSTRGGTPSPAAKGNSKKNSGAGDGGSSLSEPLAVSVFQTKVAELQEAATAKEKEIEAAHTLASKLGDAIADMCAHEKLKPIDLFRQCA